MMAQDPEVNRVIAELKRKARKARKAEAAKATRNNAADAAWKVADDARKAAHAAWAAWEDRVAGGASVEASGEAVADAIDAANAAECKAHDRSARAHYVWSEAEVVTYTAESNLEDALDCQTLADLLGCENSAVRVETQFALNPAPPAPKRKR